MATHVTDGGQLQACKTGFVSRTDTVAKNLFTLPAGAVIIAITYASAAASNAVTTATLSIGKTGTTNFFVNAADVKTAATGAGLITPSVAGASMVTVPAGGYQVVGIYAETGGASSSGGPWTVIIEYLDPVVTAFT